MIYETPISRGGEKAMKNTKLLVSSKGNKTSIILEESRPAQGYHKQGYHKQIEHVLTEKELRFLVKALAARMN